MTNLKNNNVTTWKLDLNLFYFHEEQQKSIRQPKIHTSTSTYEQSIQKCLNEKKNIKLS